MITTETRKATETRKRWAKPMAHAELTELTEQIIGSAIRVHRTIDPGFAERLYSKALQLELQEQNVPFAVEQPVKVTYKDRLLGTHRLDLVVREVVVVELKAVYQINRFHVAQLLSYLKASEKKLGLILNFARGRLEIKRVVL